MFAAITNHLLKAIVVLQLCYWGIVALVSPVTVTDSHVYNLARLPIIEKGGLFGNAIANTERQLIFPWSYDAVHLPAIWLGWGYSLFSFLCFVGTVVMILRMVAHYYGERVAWLLVLCILSFPTVVLQAVSTKNDMPLVFCVALVIYALWRYTNQPNKVWLGVIVLSLGFLPGIKSTGFIYAGVLGLWVLYCLRKSMRSVIWVGCLSVLTFLLLGSSEIYLNNHLKYGSIFGPPTFAFKERNTDGLQGGAANMIRYGFGMFAFPPSLGRIAFHDINGALTRSCRKVLGSLGLGDRGYRKNAPSSDEELRLHAPLVEESTNYGPVGAILFVVGLGVFFWFRIHSLEWKLVAAGFLFFGVLSLTMGWSPWKYRYLMLPYLLIASGAFLSMSRWFRASSVLTFVLVCLFTSISTAAAWGSKIRSPVHIGNALSDREGEEFQMRPHLREVHDRISILHDAHPGVPWIMYAGSNSWTLPFLTMKGVQMIPTQDIESVLKTLGPEGQAFIFLLDREWRPVEGSVLVHQFPEVEPHMGKPVRAIYKFEKGGAEDADEKWNPRVHIWNQGICGCLTICQKRNIDSVQSELDSGMRD